MGAGGAWKNSAGGAGWASGIGGSGPDCTVSHIGTYISCGWDVARKGGLGTGGVSCIVRGANQNMQRYSSSTGVNLCVIDANGLSPVIGQGFGEWINVIGAVGDWLLGTVP